MKLLIVEDEKDTASALGRRLSREGYNVDLAGDGRQAIRCLNDNAYDLMVLDLNLPDIDGLAVCREARRMQPSLLVFILTARSRVDEVVTGLDRGADDYLTKPFHFEELLARMRALLRHDLRCRDPQICIQDIILDPVEHAAWKAGCRLHLTRKELGILEYLMRHPGEAVSQDELIEHVWGRGANIFSNAIRVHVQALREKLGDTSANPRYIATIVGTGYLFKGTE